MIDYSKEVYYSLKQGMDIFELVNKLGFHTEHKVDAFAFIENHIRQDCWLINNKFELFDFINFFPYNGISFLITYLMYHSVSVVYKEEHYDTIRSMLEKYIKYFESYGLLDLLKVFKNYITKEDIFNLYLQNKITDIRLKVILREINRQDLFDEFVFTKQLTESAG